MSTYTQSIKKVVLALIILIAGTFCLSAQPNNSVTWRDRVFFGGTFGLVLGTETSIEISPITGYRITPRWLAGIGGTYEYHRSVLKYYLPGQSSLTKEVFSTSIYGGSLFTEFTLLKNFPSQGLSIFAHAEYEGLSLEKQYFELPQPNDKTGRFLMSSALFGGGLRQYLGGRSSMYFLVLYNANQADLSPYSNPVIRIGFMF